MGAGNVKLVYALWRDLDDAPFRLLTYMAVTAKDDGDQPKFWGGRDSLALAIGRLVPDKHTEDPAEIAERRRAFKAVTRALGALRDAGAIVVVLPAAPGRNAVYALNLTSRRVPVTGSHSTDEWSPVSGTHSGPEFTDDEPNGTHSAGTTDPGERTNGPHSAGQTDPTHRDPEEEGGEVGLNLGEEMAGVSADVTGPRATAEAPNPDSSPRPVKCAHGIKIKTRADGTASCAVCRRQQSAAGPPDPDPPPPGARCRHGLPRADAARCAGCLAERPNNVIDLDSRRSA